MTQHSPELWTLNDGGSITSEHGMIVTDFEHPMDMADKQRAVACVNACKGFPTEDLEKCVDGPHGLYIHYDITHIFDTDETLAIKLLKERGYTIDRPGTKLFQQKTP